MKRQTWYCLGDRRFKTAAKARRWLFAQTPEAIAKIRGHRLEWRNNRCFATRCVYRPAIVIGGSLYSHAVNELRGPSQQAELRLVRINIKQMY